MPPDSELPSQTLNADCCKTLAEALERRVLATNTKDGRVRGTYCHRILDRKRNLVPFKPLLCLRIHRFSSMLHEPQTPQHGTIRSRSRPTRSSAHKVCRFRVSGTGRILGWGLIGGCDVATSWPSPGPEQ